MDDLDLKQLLSQCTMMYKLSSTAKGKILSLTSVLLPQASCPGNKDWQGHCHCIAVRDTRDKLIGKICMFCSGIQWEPGQERQRVNLGSKYTEMSYLIYGTPDGCDWFWERAGKDCPSEVTRTAIPSLAGCALCGGHVTEHVRLT